MQVTNIGTFAIFFCISITIIRSYENNECTTYNSYLASDVSDKCYYNSDIFSSMTKILENHDKHYETHMVTTEDGYKLTMFRLPPKDNSKGVILLQHPLTSNGIVWLSQRNESIALILSNYGYDIWIPNHRGTDYSLSHNNKKISPKKYWDFSFHEIALFDIPAEIKYIKENTKNSKIVYIGHSMATTEALIYASMKPEEAKKSIEAFILMSPVCYLKHPWSPIKYLAPFISTFKVISEMLGNYNTLTYDGGLSLLGKLLCVISPVKNMCVMFLSFFFGWTPNEFDPSLINLAYSLNPRGLSWKTLDHYSQQYNAGGKFLMYDYGLLTNFRLYKSGKPPEYPLKNITAPIYLIYSKDDSVSTPKDSELLYKNLPEETKVFGKLKVSGLNHIDFHYGKHRQGKVYDKIFRLLPKIFQK